MTKHKTIGDPRLTTPKHLDTLALITVPGMAHFSGTGPPHTTCAGCGHAAVKSKFKNGETKAIICLKARELGIKKSPAFNGNGVLSCRHYEPK